MLLHGVFAKRFKSGPGLGLNALLYGVLAKRFGHYFLVKHLASW